MAAEAVRSILARALPPAELARRVGPLLGEAGAAALLPEVLNALGVVADADPGDPLAETLLSLVERL
ncbi:MAG: hypothetical protein K2W96_20910, partial [Gemmataceae bacterium]|nr:hypothetical protein [Gemmataceae bacterium]